MKFSKLLIAAFAVITFAATANVAQAQDGPTASITASGTVLQPLSISGTDLEFGEIFPGVKKTIDIGASAALFTIDGEGGKPVNVNFTELPENLTDGTNLLPWNSIAGHHTANASESATSYTPSEELNATLSAPETGNGELYIWLGGTVDPDKAQVAGSYSAQVTMQVTYPAN